MSETTQKSSELFSEKSISNETFSNDSTSNEISSEKIPAKPEKSYEQAFSELKNFILKTRAEETRPQNERERMLSELEVHYEASGLSDVYNNLLKDLTEKELIHFYTTTFGKR